MSGPFARRILRHFGPGVGLDRGGGARGTHDPPEQALIECDRALRPAPRGSATASRFSGTRRPFLGNGRPSSIRTLISTCHEPWPPHRDPPAAIAIDVSRETFAVLDYGAHAVLDCGAHAVLDCSARGLSTVARELSTVTPPTTASVPTCTAVGTPGSARLDIHHDRRSQVARGGSRGGFWVLPPSTPRSYLTPLSGAVPAHPRQPRLHVAGTVWGWMARCWARAGCAYHWMGLITEIRWRPGFRATFELAPRTRAERIGQNDPRECGADAAAPVGILHPPLHPLQSTALSHRSPWPTFSLPDVSRETLNTRTSKPRAWIMDHHRIRSGVHPRATMSYGGR